MNKELILDLLDEIRSKTKDQQIKKLVYQVTLELTKENDIDD